jgi:hypothetical protein
MRCRAFTIQDAESSTAVANVQTLLNAQENESLSLLVQYQDAML